MSSGFDSDDLDSFFEPDGVGVVAVILGPAVVSPAVRFTKTINVIFDKNGLEVVLYGDTDVEAADPSFECKSTDLADVKRGYTVTFPDLELHEDGYNKTYSIGKWIPKEVQTSRVTLKEL